MSYFGIGYSEKAVFERANGDSLELSFKSGTDYNEICIELAGGDISKYYDYRTGFRGELKIYDERGNLKIRIRAMAGDIYYSGQFKSISIYLYHEDDDPAEVTQYMKSGYDFD